MNLSRAESPGSLPTQSMFSCIVYMCQLLLCESGEFTESLPQATVGEGLAVVSDFANLLAAARPVGRFPPIANPPTGRFHERRCASAVTGGRKSKQAANCRCP